jgi:hypothetical protein
VGKVTRTIPETYDFKVLRFHFIFSLVFTQISCLSFAAFFLTTVALIRANRTRYFQASQINKKAITVEIVQTIHVDGRFIKFEKSKWYEVSFETARQKAAHAIQYRQRQASSNYDTSFLNKEETSGFTCQSKKQKREKTNAVSVQTQVMTDNVNTENITDLKNVAWSISDVDCLEAQSHSYSYFDGHSNDQKSIPTVPELNSNLNLINHPNDTLGDDNKSEQSVSSDAIGILRNCAPTASSSLQCTVSMEFTASQQGAFDTSSVSLSQMLTLLRENHHVQDLRIPPPMHSLFRATSDFSFGDRSINGWAMLSIGDEFDDDIF